MARKPISIELRIAIRELRGGGLTNREIGERLGISTATARKYGSEENEERCRRRHADYYQEHTGESKEQSRKRYLENQEEVIERAKAHYKEHRAEKKLYDMEYRLENREEILKKHRKRAKEYYAENREKVCAATSARLARRRATSAALTPEQNDAIKRIYTTASSAERVRCYLCGGLIPKGKRHVDHIMPLSKGGLHAPANLAIACATCNISKHAKLPEEIGLLC